MIFIEHFSHGIGLVRTSYTDSCGDKLHVADFVRADGTETIAVLACECEEATEAEWVEARANPPVLVIC